MMRPEVAQRRGSLQNERGSALGIILIMGFLMGVLGYVILNIANSQSGQSQGMEERAKAQYLAEAGYVLVAHKLMTYKPGPPLVDFRNYPDNATGSIPSCAIIPGKSHCTFGHDPSAPDPSKACNPSINGFDAESAEFIDANGNGIIGPPGDLTDPYVEVTVTNCGVQPPPLPPLPPFAPRQHTIHVKASYQ
ncbi:MAG: hypothetical protein HY352_05905 [Candidatus Omnitrophica bacterium]|nr:hypothetical protein [Candidatus Omnitrophota bacterium]